MRVFIDHKFSDTGKCWFLRALFRELESDGVRQVENPKTADLALCVTRRRTELPKIPIVLRVDGTDIVNTPRNRWSNFLLGKSIAHAQFVIWQSEWCKKIIPKLTGRTPKRDVVIPNGTDLHRLKCCRADTADINVIAVSKWVAKGKERYTKRFGDTANVLAICGRSAKTHLYGHGGGKVIDDRSMLSKIYHTANVLIYLSWVDACPNVVVDALACGCPVVCSDSSGVAELLRPGDGHVFIDKPVRGYVKSEIPPPIDYRSIAAEAMRIAMSRKRIPPRPDLWIENVAKRYLGVFNEVLK